jgi:hypothetical protein
MHASRKTLKPRSLFNPIPPHGTIVRQFMPLAGGNWLGPYEVLASVGAGGTGEVYRATVMIRSVELGRQKADAIKAFDEKLMKLGGKPAGAPASRKKASAFATGIEIA